MSGWYKMYRGWMDDPLFDGEKFCKRAAWEYLIHEAAYEDHDQWFNGKLIPIKRGQFVVSERTLSNVFGWDRQRVRTFLKRLEADQKLTRTLTQGLTLVTIENYCRFQDNQPSGKPSGEPTTNPELTHNIRRERNKEEEEEKKPTARKTRLNGDWVLPDEWRDLAKAAKGWSDEDVKAEADRFRDYWVNNTTKNALKADWKKTWINWFERSNRKPNTSLRSTMSWKDAQARVNELHSNMSMWNQMGAEARQKGDMEAREKYREFYMKAKEEREALEKAFNIQSTWS